MENPRKYPDFDFKPLKYRNCNFEGCFEGYFGKNGFHFLNIFQKTLKNTKIRIFYPKNTTSIPITLLWKSPPPPRGRNKNHYEQCIKTLKEKCGIPHDQQIRELLSVYHTMTHQPHESVADFTIDFQKHNMNLINLFQEFIRPPARVANS